MKLYILSNNKDDIIAITEYKYDMKLFCLQNNYISNKYTISKLTKDNKINKYLIKYEDCYLTEFEGYIIRNKDYHTIEELIELAKDNIKTTINSLQYMNNEYSMTSKQHRMLKDTISILKNGKSNLNEFINIKNIIHDYFNYPSMYNELNNLNDRFKEIINI